MPFPTRAALEAMKRVDLQRICKEYGVKANLKTEALIDLLLDTQSGPVPQSQQTAPLRRSASRVPSREVTGRISSVIIHDIPEDEPDTTFMEPIAETVEAPLLQAEQQAEAPMTGTRSRKAKDTQTRLGVGKPVIAGGRGARAVTKSVSVSKGKRGKSSRSLKPSEATIVEEPEPHGSIIQSTEALPAGPQAPEMLAIIDAGGPSSSSSEIETFVSNAMRPLLEQIQALRAELTQMSNLQMELQRLKTQVADMSGLQSKVEQLTIEVKELRSRPSSASSSDSEAPRTDQPSTPKPSKPLTRKPLGPGGVGLPSSFQRTSNAVAGPSHISSATRPIIDSALGKRQRMSPPSGPDNSDEHFEDGTSNDPRPVKKRLKTSEMDGDGDHNVPQLSTEGDLSGRKSTTEVSRFTVFSGPEEEDLGELSAQTYPSESDAGTSRQTRSTANASENQQPVGYSFLPIAATPAHNMYLPPFPYPEPPQSPTPEGSSIVPRGQEERTDVFHTFGLPAPSRSRPAGGSTPEIDDDFVDPLALIRGTSSLGRKREVSSNEVAAGLGLTVFGTAPTEPPSMNRTMYGTELNDDTRFGDFGVEGVGNGFWTASGRY